VPRPPPTAPSYRDSGYVFTCLNGDPMAPDRLTRTFKKLVALAGLPRIRLHDPAPRRGQPGAVCGGGTEVPPRPPAASSSPAVAGLRPADRQGKQRRAL
jgi:hypothetical protein